MPVFHPSQYLIAMFTLAASRRALVPLVKRGTLDNTTKNWEMLYKLIHYIRICIVQRKMIKTHRIRDRIILVDNKDSLTRKKKKAIIAEELLFETIKCIMFTASFRSNKNRDKKLMVLHHAVTITLMLTSERLNTLNSFIFIKYIHNFTDAVLSLSRLGYKLTQNPVIELSLIVTTLVSWMYYRFYVFGKIVIYENVMSDEVKRLVGKRSQMFYITFLTILLCMHAYWFFMMVKAVYRKTKSKKSLKECELYVKYKK